MCATGIHGSGARREEKENCQMDFLEIVLLTQLFLSLSFLLFSLLPHLLFLSGFLRKKCN